MDRASEWDDHRVPKHGVSWCATWSASFIGGVRAHVRCAARVHSDELCRSARERHRWMLPAPMRRVGRGSATRVLCANVLLQLLPPPEGAGAARSLTGYHEATLSPKKVQDSINEMNAWLRPRSGRCCMGLCLRFVKRRGK